MDGLTMVAMPGAADETEEDDDYSSSEMIPPSLTSFRGR